MKTIDDALSGNVNSAFISYPMGSAIVHPGDDESYNVIVILDEHLEDSEGPNCYTDPKASEVCRDGSIAMSPSEGHIMAAGVHCHLKYRGFLQQETDEQVDNTDSE